MTQKTELARQALIAALKLRQKENIGITDAIDVYDLAAKLGIEVRFIDLPSLEGLYIKENKSVVLLSSCRPAGRQAFNCAHELGHYAFNHGSKVDEFLEGGNSEREFDPEEYLADRFASFLLMPKSLVNYAFRVRSWDLETSSPENFYTVAGWLGVGYSTLIYHSRSSLKLVSERKTRELLKYSPKKIRTSVLGQETKENLVIVDLKWKNRPIDIQTGDLVLLMGDIIAKGDCAQLVKRNPQFSLFCGTTPGIGRVFHPKSGWASLIRVSRRDYVGRSAFRFLEDPEYV